MYAGMNSNLFKQMVHHSSIDRFYSGMYVHTPATNTCVHRVDQQISIYYAMGRFAFPLRNEEVSECSGA